MKLNGSGFLNESPSQRQSTLQKYSEYEQEKAKNLLKRQKLTRNEVIELSNQAMELKKQKQRKIDLLLQKLQQAEMKNIQNEIMKKQEQYFFPEKKGDNSKNEQKMENYVDSILRKKLGIKPLENDTKFENICEEFRDLDSFFDVGHQIKKINVLNNEEFDYILKYVSIKEKMKELKGRDSSNDSSTDQEEESKAKEIEMEKRRRSQTADLENKLHIVDEVQGVKKIKKHKEMREKVKNYLQSQKEVQKKNQYDKYIHDLNMKKNIRLKKSKSVVNKSMEKKEKEKNEYQKQVIEQIKDTGYLSNSKEKVPNTTYYNKFLKKTDHIINQAEQKAKQDAQIKFKNMDKNNQNLGEIDDFHSQLLKQVKDVRIALEEYTFNMITKKDKNRKNNHQLFKKVYKKFNPEFDEDEENKEEDKQNNDTQQNSTHQSNFRVKPQYKRPNMVKNLENQQDEILIEDNYQRNEELEENNDKFEVFGNDNNNNDNNNSIFFTKVDYEIHENDSNLLSQNVQKEQQNIKNIKINQRFTQSDNLRARSVPLFSKKNSLYTTFNHQRKTCEIKNRNNNSNCNSNNNITGINNFPMVYKPKKKSLYDYKFFQNSNNQSQINQNVHSKNLLCSRPLTKYRSLSQLQEKERGKNQQVLQGQRKQIKSFIQGLTLKEKERVQSVKELKGELNLFVKGFQGQMDKLNQVGEVQVPRLDKIGFDVYNNFVNSKLSENSTKMRLNLRRTRQKQIMKI